MAQVKMSAISKWLIDRGLLSESDLVDPSNLAIGGIGMAAKAGTRAVRGLSATKKGAAAGGLESMFAGISKNAAGKAGANADMAMLGAGGNLEHQFGLTKNAMGKSNGIDEIARLGGDGGAGLMQKIDDFAAKLPTEAPLGRLDPAAVAALKARVSAMPGLLSRSGSGSPSGPGRGAALLGGVGGAAALRLQSGDRGAPPHPASAEYGMGSELGSGGGGSTGSWTEGATMPASDGMAEMPPEVPLESDSGGPSKNYVRYTVQPGDNLIRIAKRVYGDGSKYKIIAQANGISDPNMVISGKQLVIPPGAREV